MSRPAAGSRRKVRWPSVCAFAAWLLFFGTTYSYLTPLKWGWGLNLLRYLPDWGAWLLTAFALLATTDEARRGAIAAAERLGAAWRDLPPLAQTAAIFALSFSAAWLLRDREVVGDMRLLSSVLGAPGRAAFPEPGATFVLAKLFDLGAALGHPGLVVPRLGLAAASALAVTFTVQAARLAVPDGRGAAAVPLLAFTGGLGAALTGRLDVQPLLLAGFAGYVLAGLRVVRGAGSPLLAAAALGVLVALEPHMLLLAPSLWLLLSGRPGPERLRMLAWVLAPLALHLTMLLATNPKDLDAWTVVHRALGSLRGWVRLPGTGAGLGTDYALASFGHLKYLANAAIVLAGGSIVAAGVGLRAGRGRPATPALRFLVTAWVGLVAMSLVVRPVWGPWDWELFASTGLATAFVAGALLSHADATLRAHVLVAVAGLQLAFVSVPLVHVGFGPSVDAGPLVQRRFDPYLLRTDRRPSKRIGKWL